MHLGDRAKCAVAAMLVCALAAACGNGEPGGAKHDDGSVTLNWGMWTAGSADKAAWQAVAAEVSKEHPKIEVRLQSAPFESYFTRLGTRMAGDDAPCVVSMQSPRLGGYTQGLMPLDRLIQKHRVDLSEFDASIIDGLSNGGHVYALPYDVGGMVLTYNKDMFRKAGVPEPTVGWTTAEFEAAAKRLTTGKKYGVATVPADLPMFSMVLAHSGARPTERGKLTLTGDRMVDGVGWYTDLSARQRVAPKQPGVEVGFDVQQFQSGNAAMAANGPWGLLDLKAQAKFDLGLATIPAGPAGTRTFSAGSGFGISRDCVAPEAAFKAIMTMTSEPVLARLAEQGRAYPARTAVQRVWYENAKIPGARAVLEKANATAVPFRTTKNWDQVGRLLGQYGVSACNGTTSARQYLQQVQDQAGNG